MADYSDYGDDERGNERYGKRNRRDGGWRDGDRKGRGDWNRGGRGGYGGGGKFGNGNGSHRDWQANNPGIDFKFRKGIRGRFTVRDFQLMPNMYDSIKAIAEQDQISIYQVIRDAVQKYVEERRGGGDAPANGGDDNMPQFVDAPADGDGAQ